MKTRRLFFALWPDEATRQALAHATRKAVRASGGRPVPVENLHATVAFLGSVGETRLAEVLGAGEGLPKGPFSLTVDKVEHWPKQAVLCAACSTPAAESVVLANALRSRLGALGFPPDLRPFRPHVTLARKVVKPHTLGAIEAVEWPVADLALVESETAAEGSRYTVLERWVL